MEHDITKSIVKEVVEEGFPFLIPDIRINLEELATLFRWYYSGFFKKKHKIGQVFFGLAGYTITRSAKRLAEE